MTEQEEKLLQVAHCYREGIDVEKNIEFAASLYLKVIAQNANNASAYQGLSWCYHIEEDSQINVDKWLPLTMKAAELGYADAQVVLASYYADYTNEYEKAISWYERACEQNKTSAMIEIAELIFLKYEDHQNKDLYIKGLSMLEKAYNLNHDPYVASLLGLIYDNYVEEGIQDFTKALKYSKEAAIAGDATSAYIVGVSYEKGRGVEPDYYEAVAWYRMAIKLGDEDALNRLACMCAYPESFSDLRLEPKEVISVLEQASDYSFVFCYSLMMLYETGKYGPIDHDKADYYSRKYAEVYAEYTGEKSGTEDDAKNTLARFRQNRALGYDQAFNAWINTSDSDIQRKKEILKLFEKNIREYSDLNSLKTLACIYAGAGGIPRFDGEQDGIRANSIAVDEILNVRRSFELLDKGVEWGDTSCADLRRILCNMITN